MTDDRGQLGGLEAAVFGLLVFVIGTLVVANAWGVLDAKTAASAAAREAARAYVEASDVSSAEREALGRAAEALSAGGRDASRADVRLLSGTLTRCARVTFEVRYPVALIRVPIVGSAGTGFVVAARHSEIVDPYRSGVPGSVAC